MTWLENPQDEAEKLLREGLDLAAQRTGDEITHRRVWARVADAVLLDDPQPRASGRLVLVCASAAVAVLAVAGVVAYPYLGSKGPTNLATAPTAPAPVPEPAVTPSAPPATDRLAPEESERAPGNVVRTRKGEQARVALGGGATADLEEDSAITWDKQHRPAIERGTASLSVPHQPPGWRFSVTAGPYVVTVVGTKFSVSVGGRSVGVEVSEGVVEVWRGSHSTRLVAGDSWHGPIHLDEHVAAPSASGSSTRTVEAPAPLERPQMVAAPPSPSTPLVSGRPLAATTRGLQEAEAALQSGEVSRAVEILNRAAAGSGPAAENAAYELARVTRYNLGRPRQAVALWDKYRTRFPSGLLRTETDLSIVDTLSQMGELRAAMVEAKAFLSRHPNSERRQEVQLLVDRLRAAEAASEAKNSDR